MANGTVSFYQRIRIDRVMETLDTLRVFDPHEGVELFDAYAEALRVDPEAGHRQLLDLVAREVGQEPEKARLLTRICLAVSEQESGVPPAERREIARLCGFIGLDPAVCGLGAEGAS
jgi:tellurite resistance protein